jgi:hypothetical protein
VWLGHDFVLALVVRAVVAGCCARRLTRERGGGSGSTCGGTVQEWGRRAAGAERSDGQGGSVLGCHCLKVLCPGEEVMLPQRRSMAWQLGGTLRMANGLAYEWVSGLKEVCGHGNGVVANRWVRCWLVSMWRG